MSLNKLRSLLPLLMEDPFRFDREFDVEDDGHALVVDIQDVSVLRVYQQPNDTWQAADLAEFHPAIDWRGQRSGIGSVIAR